MQLAGAPPVPRYWTLNEYFAEDEIAPMRSSIEKIRAFGHAPSGARFVTSADISPLGYTCGSW